MKSNLLFIILISFPTIIIGQSQSLTTLEDTYIIEASYEESTFHHNCPCEFNVPRKRNNCVLFNIEIHKVLMNRDSTVYNDDELLKLNYLVVEKQLNELNTKGKGTFIVTNSSSKLYLKFVRSVNIENYVSSENMAKYIGGYKCIRYNIWQKFIFMFGIDRAKIGQKRIDKGKLQRNKFDEQILEIQKIK